MGKLGAENRRSMRNELLPYGHQWIDDEDIKSVVSVLKGDWITQGVKAKEFEKAIAEFVGAKYAVVLSSGTAALHAAYFVAGINKGDEIITSPITFLSTANAALFLQAHPVFIDIEKDTGNINSDLIEEVITNETKAIIPVDYSGHPVDLERISEIAKRYNLLVVEDACHALGAEYKDEKIGSCKYSDMTVFSFHPVKSITTGEGGVVLTNNGEYYEKLVMFRQHGVTKNRINFESVPGDWYYEMQVLGYNYRLTDIQCALGISQLKKLDKFIKRRREIAKRYNEVFKNNVFFDLPLEKSYAKSSWHLYPIRLKDEYKEQKKEIFTNLRKKGLGVQVHYIPVYCQPYYQELGYAHGICPNAEDFYQREISIPLYPVMNNMEIEYTVKTILEVLNEALD